MDEYKVKILTEILNKIQKDDFYICRLKGDNTAPISLDVNAIKLLIKYYSK